MGKKWVHCVFLRSRVPFARKNGTLLKETGHFGPKTKQIAEGLKDYLSKNRLPLGGNQSKTPVVHTREKNHKDLKKMFDTAIR